MSVLTGPKIVQMVGASLGDAYLTEGNLFLRGLQALLEPNIISQTNTPPSSPNNGDTYIVGASPTGAWAAHANAIVYWTTQNLSTAAWDFWTPVEGWMAYNQTTNVVMYYTGSVWATAFTPGSSGAVTDFFFSTGAVVPLSISFTGSAKGATANLVTVLKITIPASCTVSKCSFLQADGNDANENLSLAIYDSNGTKVLDSGVMVFDAGANNVKTATLGASVALAAGEYYFAQAAEFSGSPSSPVNVYTWGTMTNASLDKGAQLYTTTATRVATSANARSGGVMPSSLGALTPVNSSNICAAMFSS